MTTPIWTLFGFALWTLLLLFATVGVYRWSRILTGRASVREWQPDTNQGSNWYKRAMQAHMNCIENLPIYAVIVFAITSANVQHDILNISAIIILIARILHSLVHIIFEQTEIIAIIRFSFYFIQIIFMLIMAIFLLLVLL